jgi:hypothetical protein
MKTPLLNALGATCYIGFVIALIQVLTKYGHDKQDTLLIPMFMLSLLVLSVTVMAFLFFYKPLCLYAENKKQEALKFFTTTVLYFSVTVFVFFSTLLYSYLR